MIARTAKERATKKKALNHLLTFSLAENDEQCRLLCDSTRAFVCRSFSYDISSKLCRLSSDDTYTSTGTDTLIPSSGITYFERSDCLNSKCAHLQAHHLFNDADWQIISVSLNH